jgi:prepilin peptidase dependent protein B
MTTLATRRTREQAGVSLVELLIGITIGLFIVGASVTALLTHLRESRSLIAQSRLMQDLRAATELMARDLRRVGYWGAADHGVWHRESTNAHGPAVNPYTALATTTSPVPAVTFRYSRDTVENDLVDDNEQFGYRLRNGVLELQLGTSPWQAMTDITGMKVTRFDITPTEQLRSLAGSCTAPCPSSDTNCPPKLLVRSLMLTLTAQGIGESTVERSVRTSVRLRNDAVTGRCPA